MLLVAICDMAWLIVGKTLKIGTSNKGEGGRGWRSAARIPNCGAGWLTALLVGGVLDSRRSGFAAFWIRGVLDSRRTGFAAL
jgi:hypothetical protein